MFVVLGGVLASCGTSIGASPNTSLEVGSCIQIRDEGYGLVGCDHPDHYTRPDGIEVLTYVFRITQIKHEQFIPPGGVGQCAKAEDAMDGANVSQPGYTYCAMKLHNPGGAPQDNPPIIGSPHHA